MDKKADRVAKQRDKGFPSRDAIVAFIRANPGKIGTREIAREFGLKNADRVELKRILRELADQGTIKKRGKKSASPTALPPTLLADITSRDSDGELIAAPAEWDEVENGEPPKIRIHMPRRPQPGTAAGVGDRALLRVEKLGRQRRRRLSRPHHQGHRSRQDPRARHFPQAARRRRTPDPGRQEAGRPRTEHRQGRHRRRRGRRSRQRRSGALARLRPDLAARSRSGSARWRSEKAISLIAIHAHDIPQAFHQTRCARPRKPSPRRLKGREDWRDVPLVTIDPPDAKDHDDAVHAEPDPDPNNKGGFIVMSRSPTSPSMCGRDRRSTATR